jgi:hypothetical protein
VLQWVTPCWLGFCESYSKKLKYVLQESLNTQENGNELLILKSLNPSSSTQINTYSKSQILKRSK